MFSGTIRSNLDPFGLYDDARLWDALRRAYLVEPNNQTELDKTLEGTVDDDQTSLHVPGTVTPASRFNLDTIIESEGANLSVGERSLLSLARALVKDCNIVVLDEAT